MSRSEGSSNEADRREDWLGRGRGRKRRWALEEQLLEPAPEPEAGQVAQMLRAELAGERAELDRLEEELRERLLRISRLERRLRALESGPPDAGAADAPRQLVNRSTSAALERDYWLCRCEGFAVESASGRIGVVEGLRFRSRIDQPDELEVRGGLFGRDLMLIPVEDVDQVRPREQSVTLRAGAPPERADVLRALFVHLRPGRNGRHVARPEQSR